MKKHENAIKAIMKNIKDDIKHYGYFEDENGARYLMNMYILIKLTGSTLDYVGDLPRLENIKLVKKFIDFIGTFKKGEHSATVNIQDIKMFDRYNTDQKPFCAKYSDNSYIGFNPYYFNKLNILTGSNLLTITDSKSPIYISGDDIECVLMPVMLDKNYNFDNYALFLEELKACYIQDATTKEKNEKQKALKNTDKIEKEVIYNGFTLYFAGKQLFILSDKKRVTNDITNDFLKIMSDITGIDYINKVAYDYIYYKSCVQAATITKITSYSGNQEIYRIETKYNPENFYKNELDKLIIYNGNMEKIDICADDMSATETTTAATQDIKTTDTTQDTKQAETPAHKSSNCLFVTVVKDLKPEKVAQLQNVANLPTLASVPTYSAHLAQKINNIVNTKRNTNNGRKAHKRTNGATLAECAGVLKADNTS